MPIKNISDYYTHFNKNEVWIYFRNAVATPLRKQICITLMIVFLFFVLFVCVFAEMKSGNYRIRRMVEEPKYWVPIEDAVNLSVDPCVDFYDFACGRWTESKLIPNYEPRVTSFSILDDFVDKKKRTVFQNSKVSSKFPRVVNDALQFYNSCMNFNATDSIAINYLRKYFKEMGGWPILEGKLWDGSKFDPVKASAYIMKTLSTCTLVCVYSSVNDSNTSQDVIYLRSPSPEAESALTDSVVIEMLYSIISVLNGSEIDASQFFNDAHKLNRAEMKWRTFFSNKTFDPVTMTFKDLNRKIPGIDWLYFIQLATNETLSTINEIVTEDDLVVIENLNYLENIAHVLQSDMFTKSDLANLFGWYAIYDLWILIPGVAEAYSSMNDFNLEGLEDLFQTKCFDKVFEIYECSIDYLYVQNASRLKIVNSLVLLHYLKNSFKDIIQQSFWLDDDTKNAALLKLNSMETIVGFQKHLNNKTLFDKVYSSYPDPTSCVLETYFKISQYQFSLSILNIKAKKENYYWFLPRSVTHVSAYYILQKNTVVFPISVHNPPFYYTHGPWYLNFGAIGSVIGHELMHGFDYNGCQRDKDGSINNWWTNASTNSFQKHLKCFKDQFKVYQNVSGHLKYDEMLTLNENIADSEGLRIAYHAFRKWTKDHGPEEEYPNLSKYTPEQMFFIAFGSMWCSKINTDMRVALSKDSHSLPEFRVLGSVSNSKDFAEAFHCAKGSPMNPATKCSLF